MKIGKNLTLTGDFYSCSVNLNIDGATISIKCEEETREKAIEKLYALIARQLTPQIQATEEKYVITCEGHKEKKFLHHPPIAFETELNNASVANALSARKRFEGKFKNIRIAKLTFTDL